MDYLWESEKKMKEEPSAETTEPLTHPTTSEVTSEHLNEVPAALYSRMPLGKKFTGECVRKKHKFVTVYLLDADLWRRFIDVGTEMIITKKGRRVFPVPSYIICDLDSQKLYNVTLQIESVDNAVHKYFNNEWVTCKEGAQLYPTPIPGRNTYLHPYSPNTGAHWMREPITFSGLKISNNLDALGTIVLQSMRKYQMSLIISELSGSMEVHIPQPETQFVAVTQYQNEQVTQMKIEHNPFANGFRFASNKREKNKLHTSFEDDDSLYDVSPQRSPKTHSSSTPKSEGGVSQIQDKTFQSSKLKKSSSNPSHLYNSLDNWSNPYGGKTGGFLPYTERLDLAKTLSLSSYMFSNVGVNPLAQVRHLGQRQLGVDTAPLALVKKRKIAEENSTTKANFKRPCSNSQHTSTNKYGEGGSKRLERDPVEMALLNDPDYMKMYGFPLLTPVDAIPNWQPSPTDLRKKEKGAQLEKGEAVKETALSLQPEITLKNRDLWETTHEVVVSAEGRLMFPYIALSVQHLEPNRQYYVSLELTPASKWLHDYIDHEWTPSMEASQEFRVSPYQHPENPKTGQELESGILFDRLRLSSARQGKNVLKVQLRRQYYPTIVLRTGLQTWQYLLKDAMFITVSIDRSQCHQQQKSQDEVNENTLNLIKSEVMLRSSQRKQTTDPKRMSREINRKEMELQYEELSNRGLLNEERFIEKTSQERDLTLQTSNSTFRSAGVEMTAHDHGLLDLEVSPPCQSVRNWHIPHFPEPSIQNIQQYFSETSKKHDGGVLQCTASPGKSTDYRIFQLNQFLSGSSISYASTATVVEEDPSGHISKDVSAVNDSFTTTISSSYESNNEDIVVDDLDKDEDKDAQFTNPFLFQENPEEKPETSSFLSQRQSNSSMDSGNTVGDIHRQERWQISDSNICLNNRSLHSVGNSKQR
ncbi:T-box transcription factor TBX21 [Biomphalaria glabrata]